MATLPQALENKDFVATDEDITRLAQSVLTASQESDSSRRTYLKTLIATTQQTIGVAPRMRTSKDVKASPEEVRAQIAALNTVHERFYALVTQVAQESVPAGTKDRGVQINRMTNFARTALSAVRRWVRAGNDITALAAHAVTKASLAVPAPRSKRPSAAALKARARRTAGDLIQTYRLWGKADKEAATDALRAMIAALTKQFSSLKPLRSVKTAKAPKGSEELRKAA